MVKCLRSDPRLPKAHEVDIVVRKDGREQRTQADWLKVLGRLYKVKGTHEPESTPPPVVVSSMRPQKRILR